MKKERLRIENLRKGTLLKRLHLQVFEGEILHCVFDNIQEKQMFLKIITGEKRKDYGKFYYGEREIEEKKLEQLLKSKVSVISRKSNLIESVTIGENIFLIRPEVTENWLRSRQYKKKAQEIFKEFEIRLDASKPTKHLSEFEKVQIELIKAYLMGRELLILTSLDNTLSSQEKQSMMSLLEKLRDRGLSCIIAEPLEDLDFTITDTVVIIKHGKTCAVKEVSDCDYMMLHTLLYYDEIEKRTGERKFLFEEFEKRNGVEISGLSSAYLKNIHMVIGKGEIVKLFCMDEKSYDEITGVLRGKIPVTGGCITVSGETKNIKHSIGLKNGVGIVEGNPAEATLFEELSTMDNLLFLLSRKVQGVWVRAKYKKSIRILLQDIISKDMYKKTIKELDSSEVQKVLYSRWFLYSPELLVCIQPFAEGDIQARETARQMIYMLRKRKIPILIVTSNTAEFNYCSGRALYVRHGKIISKEEAYTFLYSDS